MYQHGCSGFAICKDQQEFRRVNSKYKTVWDGKVFRCQFCKKDISDLVRYEKLKRKIF